MKKDTNSFWENPEFTQALVRLGIGGTLTAFIGIARIKGEYSIEYEIYAIFAAAFTTYSVIVFISILFIRRSRIRPYLTIPFDFLGVSYSMIMTGAGPFSVYVLLYPWIYISYGVRYGSSQLFTAAAVSVAGFVIVLWYTNSFSTNIFDSTAYITFLLILPLYVNTLIRNLIRARRDADIANHAKSNFLSTMSHEIRTPMSGIVGISSLLDKTSLNDEQREYVDALQQSSFVLRNLIDDILDVSKIEAGKYQLNNRQFDLSTVLHSVAKIFTPNAYAKGLDLLSFYSPKLPRKVIGDPNCLRQVLLNLVSNAVKFTEKGEVSIRAIPCETKSDGQTKIRIEVSDTGIGIPEDKLKHIFDPFYQADNYDLYKNSGTGLGTTISYQLISLMGGEIGVSSKNQNGSLFWVELPYNLVLQKSELPQKLPPHNVLILDRNNTSRTILKEYCAALGSTVTFADNEKDVINQLKHIDKNVHPNMVMLCDTQLAHNSLNFARQLRNYYGNDIFLCRLTYLARITEVDKQSMTLFNHTLIRPLDFDTLSNCIKKRVPPSVINGDEAHKVKHADNLETRPLKVLVAEDNEINAKVLTVFLGKAGHHVDRVKNGQQALEKLTNKNYDFVLMDMRMPEMNGVEATRMWRKNESHEEHLPIVALTANATVEDREQCLAAGMDNFLTKPVNQERLLELIDTLTMVRGN